MKAQVSSKGLAKKISNLNDIKDSIMPKALKYFRSVTPYRSGNARKRTGLDGNKDIQAKYAYASVLDSGSSKQAPQGMIKPTEKEITRLVRDYLKRLGA